KYLYLQLKQYSGHLDPKEAGDLSALAGANLSGDEKESADKLFATLKQQLAKDNTAEYYAPKVARLMKELDAAKTQFANTDQQLKKANDRITQMNTDMEKERDEWKKKLDAAVAQNLKERQDQENKFQSMLAEFGDLNKKLGELSKKAELDNETAGKGEKKRLDKNTELEGQSKKTP